jgi:hypothetical protein
MPHVDVVNAVTVDREEVALEWEDVGRGPRGTYSSARVAALTFV